MVDRDEVCVLIPTLDEAETIGDVLEGFVEQGFEHLLVVDGGSTDGTVEIAEENGASVVQQTASGKGQAVREGFEMVEQPYVVFLDGDGTYRPDQADRFLDALEDYDHVLGDRFADLQPGAMPRLNQFGNRLINAAFRLVHGRDLQDILSGYRALRTDVIDRLELEADGFGIETELSAEAVRRDVSTGVVPITYEPRPAGSEANLRPFRDGFVIAITLYALARTHNPLFYFGVLGAASTAVGVGVATFVAYDWFVPPRTPHNILAIVAAGAILLGVQLLMFGVLSDLVVTLHREQMRLIERMEDEPDR
jgi:glycosyltransferase (TIGR04182 family)